jgi:sigma-B regulation protein RsbU (phosphoserine phosphatase)
MRGRYHNPEGGVSNPSQFEAIERSRRALTVLYNISVACRGQIAFQPIFETITAELRGLFAFDACYIAVCDMSRAGFFRAALLIDEALSSYEEGTEYGALTGSLLSQRRPLLFRDLPLERRGISGQAIPFGDVGKVSRSWAGVPLVLGEQTLGVISLQSYTPGVYGEADVELLQEVGNLAAVVIENATLGQGQRELSAALAAQVTARTRELAALGDLAAEMVRGQPLDVLLDRVLRRIADLFGIDAAIVRLIDQLGEDLGMVAQYGMPDEYMRLHMQIPMGGTLIGRAIAEGRALVIGPEFAGELSRRGLPFQSALSVPLRIGDRTLGGMSLLSNAPRRFSREETDVAMALGNQVAIAIENARLFAERDLRVSELSTLGAIARAASTALDLPMLLRQVHSALSELLPLDAFSMVVYDPERRLITDGVSIDEGEEYGYWHRQAPPPDSLTAWVIQHRRPLHFDDMAAEIGGYPELARRHLVGSGRHAVSWLGVPLINRAGDAIGVISIQSYAPAVFSRRDESFLLSVAGQVALHVQNVALLARRERQIRELDAIGRVSQHVSAALSLEEMLRPIYEVLQSTAGVSSFFLVICESISHHIRHAFYVDGGEQIHHEWPGGRPPEGSLTAWILNNSRPLLFDDIRTQEAELRAIGVQPVVYGSDDRPRSWVGVPLLDPEANPIGVIALQDSRAFQYDRQTIEFLSQISAHISLGVQKAELFAAERSARLPADTLREVARVLNSTFDPGEVLEIILRELQHVIAYDTASVMLLENYELRIVAQRGWDEAQAPRGVTFPLEKGSAAGIVVRSQEPLAIADTRDSPYWNNTLAGVTTRAWLGVPLAAKGHVLGVLNIDSCTPGRFTTRDVEVALAFANQAAVALENARLYAESVARVEQELAIARQIQSKLFPRELPRVAGLRLAARCLPARETGGDFYDCFMLAAEAGVLALMVGDASGKSVPGAMLMAIARSVARSEARDHIEPAAVLRETNQLMALDVPRGSFVALSYATIDLRRRRLSLASAGQIAPLRRRADGTIDELLPPGSVLPLGIEPRTFYQALEVELAPGDTLVLLTDGLVEAHDAYRQMFGFERLERLLAKHGGEPPEQLLETILGAVSRFMGAAPQHDDMTVMIVQVD